MGLLWYSLTLEQKSTPSKNKLDSAMARLNRLCSQDEGDNDGLWSENGHEQRAKLFEWVFGLPITHHRAHFILAF